MKTYTIEPAWMKYARREAGQKEIPGGKHNPRIIEYHACTTLKATSDEVPWCASFVNWALMRGGVKGTLSAAARSFLSFGRPLSEPIPGCIVVFRRGAAPAGHVGFFMEKRDTRAPSLLILGGNQGDAVSLQWFPESEVLGYRWPTQARALPIAAAAIGAALLATCTTVSVQVEHEGWKVGAAVSTEGWAK